MVIKKKLKKIKCHKCFYIFKTKSKLMLVTCPNCGFKINTEKQRVK